MERVEKKPILSSAIRAMLNTSTVDKEEKPEAKEKKERVSQPKADKKKQNPKAYARYRGKSETGQDTKAMSWYVTDDQIRAIELRKQRGIAGERDRSAIVRAALNLYLAEEMKLIQKG